MITPRLAACACVVGLLAAGRAPFQCSSKQGPEMRLEDDPAQALYRLAQQFKAEGDDRARVETLEYIVKRYPASRFATQAKLDLDGHAAK
ncbi:MAG TPA: hypothetical protein VHB21_12175 [Minicystis sp.]|nr:hypothetical protein [Minicystis sp.]